MIILYTVNSDSWLQRSLSAEIQIRDDGDMSLATIEHSFAR